MAVPELIPEIDRFCQWASALPRRSGEWESEYTDWGSLYDAVLDFISQNDFRSWSVANLEAVLFAIARDNELEHLAGEIRRRFPGVLVALSRVAVENGERDAKWQLASELGQLENSIEDAESLLLLLVRDADEYVRRRSLQALARIGSSAVQSLAVFEWNRPDPTQQWTRMNVLWCLHRIKSPLLENYLKLAEEVGGPYLRDYARRVSQGHVDP